MPAADFNTLVFEQPAFDRYQPTLAVAGETTQAIAGNDPMAWHHNGHRIAPAGIAYCPGTTSQATSQRSVRYCFTDGY